MLFFTNDYDLFNFSWAFDKCPLFQDPNCEITFYWVIILGHDLRYLSAMTAPRSFPCFPWPWPLGRNIVGGPSIEICPSFSHDYTSCKVGEEDCRAKVPFAAHHAKTTHHQYNLRLLPLTTITCESSSICQVSPLQLFFVLPLCVLL